LSARSRWRLRGQFQEDFFERRSHHGQFMNGDAGGEGEFADAIARLAVDE
jgi:hypothetical protein